MGGVEWGEVGGVDVVGSKWVGVMGVGMGAVGVMEAGWNECIGMEWN